MKKLMTSVFLFIMLWIASAQAADVNSLYQAQIPVPSESQADWQQAIPQALIQVLIQVSGNEQIAQAPQVVQQLAHTAPLVQSFSYIDSTGTNGQSVKLLQVQFDQQAVNQLLHQAGAAKTSSGTQNQQVTIRVTQVNGLGDVTNVLKYLRGLPPVRSAEVAGLDQNDIMIQVAVAGGLDALNQAISAGTGLQPLTPPAGPASATSPGPATAAVAETAPAAPIANQPPSYRWTMSDTNANIAGVNPATTPAQAPEAAAAPVANNTDQGIDMSGQ